jgi:ubiquitin-protein ligase
MPLPAMRRLMRELKELRTSPPEGIRVQLSEESVLDLVGIVEGPGMSFRDEAFRLRHIDVSLQRVHRTKGVTFA